MENHLEGRVINFKELCPFSSFPCQKILPNAEMLTSLINSILVSGQLCAELCRVCYFCDLYTFFLFVSLLD